MLFSRHRADDLALNQGIVDRWIRIMSGGKEEELFIRREMKWLSDHNKSREYFLAAITKPIPLEDELNDSIPF